jgi:formate-dependent phosphoribosylglycinamide formyltransferase (GAR transformylase)/SAM-dependent methyltransferase
VTSPRLLILGGNRYNVSGIEAAKASGFVTLVADGNPAAEGLKAADYALPVDLRDADRLEFFVQKHGGVDGIVSMAEVGVRTAAELSWRMSLPSISRDAARCATSKALMRERWKTLGSMSPDFRIVANRKEALTAAASLGRFPLISKPDLSHGGSRGVCRIETMADVCNAFDFSRSQGLPDGNIVIEQCVQGTEYSAEVLIWKGDTHVICVGEKVKSPPPYRVDLSVQYPALLTPRQMQNVSELCDLAIDSLGLSQGIAHIEFALTEDGFVLFELGARCGGGHTPQIVAHVSGVDEFIESCRMACGREPLRRSPRTSKGAEYRFLVMRPGKLTSSLIPPVVKESPQILDAAVTLSDGTVISPGPVRSTSDRHGFIVAIADSREQAKSVADWASTKIQLEYSDGQIASPIEMAELTPHLHEITIAPQSPLKEQDLETVVQRYRGRIQNFGVTLQSLASGDAARQELRHRIHATAISSKNATVLDVGCGLGCFLSFLRKSDVHCRYTGYDMVPEYIHACRQSFPDADFFIRNIFNDGIEGTWDTIVMSQVLNNKYRFSDNMLVMKTAIELCFKHCRNSISIDMMSIFVDYQNPDLFYYNPADIFNIARSVARRVVIRHDYRPHEFCVQLFRDEAPDFIP